MPVTISPKRNTPSTEKMKKKSSISAPTFTNDGNENISVSMSFYSPLIDLTSFSNLVTRKTLTTRASCGPNLRNDIDYPPRLSIVMSTKDEQTTKQSNLFQPSVKYTVKPVESIFSVISAKNTPEKK